MTILLASTFDAAVVLAVALAATAVLLRRRSAALRHAILATAIVSAFLMPLFEMVLPQLPVIRWHIPATLVSSEAALSSEGVVAGSAIGEAVASAGKGLPWQAALVILWMLGAMATSAGLMTGLVRLARLTGRCTPVAGRWREVTDELSRECGIRRHVALLQSDDPSLLVAGGVLNPRIILPAGAAKWTDDRIRIVVRHELAHIRRHDGVVQVAGEVLRVLQWLNPLVWIACRRLRQESEYACDDAVLSGGVDATEYATHLLDVARHLSGRHGAWASAPAIAQPSTLERRIVAMLHRQQNRAPFGGRGWFAAALVALGVSLPLAAAGVTPAEPRAVVVSEARDVTLPAAVSPNITNTQLREAAVARPSASAPVRAGAAPRERIAALRQTPATVIGTVLDQSGGAMPGVQVTLTDTQTGAQITAHTDAGGRFAFRDVRPAQYQLAARMPGFATFSGSLTVQPDTALQRTITLPLGTLQETVTVVCAATAAANVARPRNNSLTAEIQSVVARVQELLRSQALYAQEPIRVGGNVRPPKKLRDVRPICPPTVPPTDTVVRLTGRIGVDGFISDVTLLPAEGSAEPPKDLIDSAIDAVRQWMFTPTLLNGQAVEVNISVQVTFRKS